jgi:hypothetical protein
VRQLEEVRNAEYCDYIRPPIDKYGTLQFDNYEEIKDVGYYHGQVFWPPYFTYPTLTRPVLLFSSGIRIQDKFFPDLGSPIFLTMTKTKTLHLKT